MKRCRGGMGTAAVHVRWPVLMFVFSGSVYTLQMSVVMPPSVISLLSLSLSVSLLSSGLSFT